MLKYTKFKRTMSSVIAFTLIAMIFSVGSVLAQSTTATLNGTVTDAAGAVIPDAQVTVTNQDTKQEITTRTNGEGGYSVPGLTSGTYQVTVSKTRFPALRRKIFF